MKILILICLFILTLHMTFVEAGGKSATTTPSPTLRTYVNSNLAINGNKLTLNTNDPTVSFFALGDWGGAGITGALSCYTSLIPSLNTPSPAQLSSAKVMGILGSQYNSKFQLGLGDNFYLCGVSSKTDRQFKEIFEDVYSASQLKNTPWFHTLGNHDYLGDYQAQTDYMSLSNRWILPNFNYSINVMTSNSQLKLVSILMVDSIRLCGNTQTSLTNAEDVPSFSKVPSSFTNAASMAALYFQDLENQLKTISASGVPYIIVGSHFPIFSVAEHGSTQCLINSLMPLLHKYKVSLYLSGHDHNLQHISYTYLNSTVEYMVVGANALNSNSQANINSVPPNSLKFQWPTKGNIISNIVNDALLGGFLAITASPVGMTVNFIKAGPPSLLSTQPFTVLYTKNILPRV